MTVCLGLAAYKAIEEAHISKEKGGTMNDTAADLAEEHWRYVEQVIRNEYDADGAVLAGEYFDLEAYIRRVKYHYITAFIHGYKHGADSIQIIWTKKGGE